ncbi:hypothetical protein V1358_09705 [Pseudoalteromonas sp. YIC-656]|uniref:hypothetical protein n=1 Tax=Pseudoalteromonas pernae TaxID=3118054 RepID=UPI00324206B4
MISNDVYSEVLSNGKRTLILRNGLTKPAIEKILKNEYDCLWLYYGNFEEMVKLPLECIHGEMKLQCSEAQNVSWVSMLSSIDSLSIKGKIKGSIDFSKLKALSHCEIDWCATSKGIISSRLKLRSLSLSKFSGQLLDFCEETASNLSTLGLTGSLTSLHGLKRFTNLRELSLWNMRKLQDVSELELCKNLKCLQIESCNSIEYEAVLKKISNLEELFFENKELRSLRCLPKPTLKKIVLGQQTKILDKDVEDFMEFPNLEVVSYKKKKGYKYSAEELGELLRHSRSK